MNYDESLKYIHSLLKFGVVPGLERIKALLHMLGNPQDQLKFVHVAGTNGKGSVCTMSANILQHAGYKTGLFTSPYVIDFCERIQIDGNMIGHSELARLVTTTRSMIEELARQELQPTEFEVITAIAMKYFAMQKCDIVVLETGLGGRLDSTNIIGTPLASIITCISLDHTEILGNTIEKIATEKCGIIKQNGTTICYPCQLPMAMKVIESSVHKQNNQLVLGCLSEIIVKKSTIKGTILNWNGIEINLNLVGEHQVLNASTAISAMIELGKKGFNINRANIKYGIENTTIPARFEVLSIDPIVILDGGHNSDGIDSFVSSVKKLLPKQKKIFIMGTMADKDYEFTIQRVARAADEFIATTPSNPRALHACTACEIASAFCKKTAAISSPKDAITYAFFQAKTHGYAIIICGSLYLAGDVRDIILKKLPSPQG
ncbi:MAG: bifunctional folylpolyglutamate synthase/dihydrofolate synthase [Clostridia bacterium]|nr:bifunctional folylpolyglutamate synthase/dihydrofolate synthase [Clostridia bacterium]